MYFRPLLPTIIICFHAIDDCDRLAAKGIVATRTIPSYGASDAISIGKTLLQQLMEANKDTLEARLDAYNKHKAECQVLNKGFALAKGNSKALPSQFIYKPGAADDTRKRANVHHTGRYASKDVGCIVSSRQYLCLSSDSFSTVILFFV